MAVSTKVRIFLNRFLAPVNVQIESLTAFRKEQDRLESLVKLEHFSKPVFPLFKNIDNATADFLARKVRDHSDSLNSFHNKEDNEVGYSFSNDYFSSPDTEILYSVVRTYCPKRIVEIGSGNSTKIARQAILDAKLSTEIVSIDPYPRCDVTNSADQNIPQNVETITTHSLFDSLSANDILFIDSSHEVRCGNDVVFLLLNVVPTLQPGVLIHLHDIFLPFEYPKDWIVANRWNWNEQYLVQALVGVGDAFDVLWAGHYFQRCNPSLMESFVHWRGQDAKSLWLRKR
jgi:hypothetical protein